MPLSLDIADAVVSEINKAQEPPAAGFGPAFTAVPLPVWFDLGLAAYLLNPESRAYAFDRYIVSQNNLFAAFFRKKA